MTIERNEVAKAGGWSLANGERTRNVMAYIASLDIRYFVPSAPGIINEGDSKVTDLLIDCYKNRAGGRFRGSFEIIRQRYEAIAREFGYHGLPPLLDKVEETIVSATEKDRDLVISRGEWLEGHMMADLLGFRFIDPTELIGFRKDGLLDERSYQTIRTRLRRDDRVVIPGFFGLGSDGRVRTFPRDGSDVTGSVIARGVNASIYRNLTSTDGVYSADPRILRDSKLIHTITFEEYRELGNGGIKVLHRDTIVPVANAGIPINVRHSEEPDSIGTMVVSERLHSAEDVIGIAGRSDLLSLNIHKFGLNDERGVESRILTIIRKLGISIDHTPSGNDRLSVIFSKDQFKNKEQFKRHEDEIIDEIIDRINRTVRPRSIELQRHVGFVSVVGQGIRENKTRVSSRLFKALDNASINCTGSTSALSGISIIAFVNSNQVKDAIIAAHKEFI